MKRLGLVVFVAAIALGLTALCSVVKAADQCEFRVMSFNISCDYGADGDNNWEFRDKLLINVIKTDDPLFLGVQEAVPAQMAFLKEQLPDYQAIGLPRDDGKEKGECMAIFFKKDFVELLDGGTFWLSETPEVPSKGWDAACNRTVTWGKFKCKKTGKIFCYANTHLDHMGTIARAESAKLLLRRMHEITQDELPLFISGDFNVTDQSDVYNSITKGVGSIPGLRDSNKIAKERKAAQEYTFHDWDRVPADQGNIIDYIFVDNKIDVQKFKINPVKETNGRCASDHVSIVATIAF